MADVRPGVVRLVLLVGLPVMMLTGLLSYAAYDPALGGSNEQTPARGLLGAFLVFDWPTSPSWLYRVNQGTHVMLGLALVPVVLAKLWSVAPKLFAWPPVRSQAELERHWRMLMGPLGFSACLLWIIVYYLSQTSWPVPALGPWNIMVGFGIMFIGFLMTTRWR